MILFDLSDYSSRYNMRNIVLDLHKAMGFDLSLQVSLIDTAKTKTDIENDLYCNLPLEFISTYRPFNTYQLVEKLLEASKPKKTIVFSTNTSFYNLLSPGFFFVDIGNRDNWVFWDNYKFKDTFGFESKYWDEVFSFCDTFPKFCNCKKNEERQAICNLLTNFSDKRTSLSYFKHEFLTKKELSEWDPEVELAFLERWSEKESGILIDFVSYSYTSNIEEFENMVKSLDINYKEDIIKTFLERKKFKTG